MLPVLSLFMRQVEVSEFCNDAANTDNLSSHS